MALQLRWVGADEIDRVAEARMLSYASGRRELESFQKNIREEPRSGPGDWLLAERDGAAVGTSTALPLWMWARGGRVRCQGVAFVGTIKTARRKVGSEPGIGTALMRETIRAGRERGFVASALMPFRASYYEHFGYGIVERRRVWTVPLTIAPDGDFETIRFYRADDFNALLECRQRLAERGQCDIERSGEQWQRYVAGAEAGFLVVDRDGSGPVRGWMMLEHGHEGGLDTARAAWDFGWEDAATLKRFLCFLSSLKDQYRFAQVQLPADVPLNLLLKEKQMTHRVSKNHPNADSRPFTRMQVRVLDHRSFLESMRVREDARGSAVVAVHEPEGDVAAFRIELGGGRIVVTASSASAQVRCAAAEWAMIACGELKASAMTELGLIEVEDRAALAALDVLGEGPAPYCREYF